MFMVSASLCSDTHYSVFFEHNLFAVYNECSQLLRLPYLTLKTRFESQQILGEFFNDTLTFKLSSFIENIMTFFLPFRICYKLLYLNTRHLI
jgi:hypothetical protein